MNNHFQQQDRCNTQVCMKHLQASAMRHVLMVLLDVLPEVITKKPDCTLDQHLTLLQESARPLL